MTVAAVLGLELDPGANSRTASELVGCWRRVPSFAEMRPPVRLRVRDDRTRHGFALVDNQNAVVQVVGRSWRGNHHASGHHDLRAIRERSKMANGLARLLVGLGGHGAGVHDDDSRRPRGLDTISTPRSRSADAHRVAIDLIDLAAECVDVDAGGQCGRSGRRPETCDRSGWRSWRTTQPRDRPPRPPNS